MKITKTRLKQLIKEEIKSCILQESAGWFDWRDIELLLADRNEEGDTTRDLVEILQEMGAIIVDQHSHSMNKYDMKSRDFVHDVLSNYENELEPYMSEYPDMDFNDMAEILDDSLAEALANSHGARE